MTHSKKVSMFGKTVLAASLAFALAGCVDDGDTGPQGPAGMDGADGVNGTDGVNGAPSFPQGLFLVANNGAENAGTVDTVDQSRAYLSTFTTGNNEGIALDGLGNLYQAGDATNGSLRAVCRATSRSGGMFMASKDREITGESTGLVNPKGIHFDQSSGLVFVADFNGQQISVFGSNAAGNAMPVAEIMLSAKPWDVTYDAVNDRMYAALTDGTVAVYDQVMAMDFAPTVMRSIVPSDADGNQISVNLHGIVYDASTDRLIVSDVGDASVADDGQVFVLSGASMADGMVEPMRQIGGPMSMLGNPVDIILTGTTLRVAEKSNDAVLVFSNIYSGMSGDMAPDLASASVKPESLAEVMPMPMMYDISDNALNTTSLLGVAVSSNPSTAGATTGEVAQFSAVLNAQTKDFNFGMSIESVTYDLQGDAYATFDDPTTSMGGVLIGSRIAKHRDGEMYSMMQDRMIMGANTGLVTPKGLDVNSEHGLIFVAELDATAPGIFIFSGCAEGDVMPLLKLIPANGARPWDVDYDAATDRAFAALTNGTIAVFDQVTAKLMSGTTEIAGEDRLITPAMAGVAVTAPTNIHGIDYDVQSDSLVVSDVGSAADATDGKLYVLPGAGMANGLTDMSVSISGPATMLGNPVDIMLSNGHVYVAEKSNDMIMRWDNILNRESGDIPADYGFSYTKPESVAVIPAYLW